MKHLKNIFRYLSRKHERILSNFKLKHLVFKYNNFLSSGSYRVSNGGKIIFYLEDEVVLQFIKKNSKNFSPRKRNRLGIVFDSFFKFNVPVPDSTDQDFSGQVLMVTVDQDIKVFDFKNSQVLTIYKNPKKKLQIKHAINILSEFFDHPHMDFSKEDYQVEELIQQNNYETLTDFQKNDIFETLISKYIKYFSNLNLENLQHITPADMCKKFRAEIPEDICLRFEKFLLDPSFKDISWKLVFLHGDLNYSNILLHHEKIKLIDFEYANFYLFIYDLFNYIYMEKVTRNNCYFLTSYYAGKYDALLNKLFAQFDMVYQCDKKTAYMFLYLTERLLVKGFCRKWFNNGTLPFIKQIEKLHENSINTTTFK